MKTHAIAIPFIENIILTGAEMLNMQRLSMKQGGEGGEDGGVEGGERRQVGPADFLHGRIRKSALLTLH